MSSPVSVIPQAEVEAKKGSCVFSGRVPTGYIYEALELAGKWIPSRLVELHADDVTVHVDAAALLEASAYFEVFSIF